jgi:hypothetical protein
LETLYEGALGHGLGLKPAFRAEPLATSATCSGERPFLFGYRFAEHVNDQHQDDASRKVDIGLPSRGFVRVEIYRRSASAKDG